MSKQDNQDIIEDLEILGQRVYSLGDGVNDWERDTIREAIAALKAKDARIKQLEARVEEMEAALDDPVDFDGWYEDYLQK